MSALSVLNGPFSSYFGTIVLDLHTTLGWIYAAETVMPTNGSVQDGRVRES